MIVRFCLLDKITYWTPGQTVMALKNVTLNEDFFGGHLPLKPMMPGTLIIEGLAQLSGFLLEEEVKRKTGRPVEAFMNLIEKAEFHRRAYPGDQLVYRADLLRLDELGGQTRARAFLEDNLALEAKMLFSFHELTNREFQKKRRLVEIWLEGLERPPAGAGKTPEPGPDR